MVETVGLQRQLPLLYGEQDNVKLQTRSIKSGTSQNTEKRYTELEEGIFPML